MGLIFKYAPLVKFSSFICGASGGQQYELTSLLTYIKTIFFAHCEFLLPDGSFNNQVFK